MIFNYKRQLTLTASRLRALKFKQLPKMPKAPFKVAIEGNIGAGKSTLIDYYSQFPNVEVYPVRNISCISYNLYHDFMVRFLMIL